MTQIIGSFYFKKTTSGNLIGEFTNNNHETIFSESCDLKILQKDLASFEGTYLSTWQEESESILMELEIMRNSNQMKYYLIWTLANEPIFKGEGFLVDDLLIGHYVSMKS